MCGWKCSDRLKGCCRAVRGAWRALRRLVIERYLIGWIVCISRVFLFGSHIHCSLLLLPAFKYSNG